MQASSTNTLETYGRKAADAVEDKRMPAAAALDRAGRFLEEKMPEWTGCRRTASGLHHAANYVRGHNVDTMKEDAVRTVRQNPGYSLLAAAAVGFLVGRGMWRR